MSIQLGFLLLNIFGSCAADFFRPDAFLQFNTTSDDIKIVGGREVDITQRPYMVSIGDYSKTDGYHFFCGGSLITRRHVLTAAHCHESLDTSDLRVKLGVTNVDGPGRLIKILKFKNHPLYNSLSMDNDIAIITLQDTVNLTPKTQVVPVLLKKPRTFAKYATTSGWGNIKESGGSSAKLRTVDVPIIDAKTCREKSNYGEAITDKMICAGYPIGGKDACQGDSGGPLVYEGKQLGVISWGQGCAREGYPGVYTDVTEYIFWIRAATSWEVRLG